MATEVSMAIRSDKALERIEAQFEEWGIEYFPIPRTNQQAEMLRCIQLELIADALEQIPSTAQMLRIRELVNRKHWTKTELKSVVNDG